MDSLINSVHSALITVNEGWQLSHVSSADFFLFFFLRGTQTWKDFKPSPETKGYSLVLSLDCRKNRSLVRI